MVLKYSLGNLAKRSFMSETGGGGRVLTGLFRQPAAYLFPKMKDSLRTPLAIDPRDTPNLHRCEANEFASDAIVLEGLGWVISLF